MSTLRVSTIEPLEGSDRVFFPKSASFQIIQVGELVPIGTGSIIFPSGSIPDTGSFLITASADSNVITFTKGDASTFNITVNTGSGGGGDTAQTVQNVVMNGTGSNTTASLVYGINVVVSSSASNFCARLPIAEKGKTVTVINTTNYKARILPSQTGGSVNGVVNGGFDIPANSQAYNFVCYENPAPGEWVTLQTPLSTTEQYPEFIIDHTSGSDTNFAGVYQITDVSGTGVGSGVTGDDKLFLVPGRQYWDSKSPDNAIANKFRIYTNAVYDDFKDPVGGQNYFDYGISALVNTAFLVVMNNDTGSTSGWKGSLFINKNEFPPFPFQQDDDQQTIDLIPANGPANNPILPGDAGTAWGESVFVGAFRNGVLGNYTEIGASDSPVVLSDYFYTFGIVIGAQMPTKRYRFRFELDTQTI